jgi:hypothetical protein
MNGRGTAPAKVGTMGEESAMPVEERCGVDSCEERRVAAFRDENLCCDHFLCRGYEFLERIDPNRDLSSNGGEKRAELKRLIEECAQRALEVALGSSNLSNLQRARLLDILLWTTDITIAGQLKNAGDRTFLKSQRTGSTTGAEAGANRWNAQGPSLRTSLLW